MGSLTTAGSALLSCRSNTLGAALSRWRRRPGDALSELAGLEEKLLEIREHDDQATICGEFLLTL
jgi:hypothetical protein